MIPLDSRWMRTLVCTLALVGFTSFALAGPTYITGGTNVGTDVTVSLANPGSKAVQLQVTIWYEDTNKVLHTDQTVVSLNAGQSLDAGLVFSSITGPFNPSGITVGKFPVPGMIVMGTALWVD